MLLLGEAADEKMASGSGNDAVFKAFEHNGPCFGAVDYAAVAVKEPHVASYGR